MPDKINPAPVTDDPQELAERAEELRGALTSKELKCAEFYVSQCSTRIAAYRHAYAASTKKGKTPSGIKKSINADTSNATDVFSRPDFSEYISVLRRMTATRAVLSLHEKRVALAEIVRFEWSRICSEGGNLSLAKAAKLRGHLIKQIKQTFGKGGVSNEIELNNALDAIRLDNEISGHNKPVKIEAGDALIDAVFNAIKPTTGLNSK